MPLLRVTSLSKSFGGVRAVRGVSFDVEQGQIKALIGPNGAGKTTLFNLVSGFVTPDAGEVRFDDRPIQGLPPFRAAALGLSRTFQNIKLFPHMTALENVMTGCHTLTRTGFFPAMLGLPVSKKEDRDSEARAMTILERLSLASYARRHVEGLPFGIQKLLEIARALAMEPELLLLDEPAAGLNMRETAEIASLIRKIRDAGITVVLIEHDMSLVMNISDRVLVLNSGQRIAEGTPHEVQRNPEVIKVYLGEDDA